MLCLRVGNEGYTECTPHPQSSNMPLSTVPGGGCFPGFRELSHSKAQLHLHVNKVASAPLAPMKAQHASSSEAAATKLSTIVETTTHLQLVSTNVLGTRRLTLPFCLAPISFMSHSVW